MKICSKCKQQKDASEFYKTTTNVCKSCFKERAKLNYFKNRNRRLEQMKNYYSNNKDNLIDMANNYYKNNRELILQNKRRYFQKNKNKIVSRMNAYKTKRHNSDINFKLRDNLRSRLNHAIRNNQKSGSAISDLGCTIEELKIHLASKFLPGMTWDNYGEWEIDRVRPLSSFDLTDHNQVKLACNHINLQPLWWQDNVIKGNSLTEVAV